MKNILPLFVFLLFSKVLLAQYPTAGGDHKVQANIGHFYGKVIDAKTNKGIEFATLQLFQDRTDTATHAMKRTLISGALTESNGDFNMENLPVMGEYLLRITAIGYDSLEQKVSFGMGTKGGQHAGTKSGFGNTDKDLGNIKLQPSSIELNEVVVNGEEPAFQLQLDKKVYSVDKDPTNAGTTADEVLKKIPGVSVDLDNNVTLRNATPTIFVDGRPTTLTIDQIPSDIISKIEVITNPSAKYDASSGQAGIINIVLKKNKRIGYNGNLRAGIDMRGRVNLGGDVNIRQGKINVFASGNFRQRKSLSYNELYRHDRTGDTLIDYYQNDTSIHTSTFRFGNAGIDFFANNRNTFSLSGNFFGGSFNNDDPLYIVTDSLYEWGIVPSYSTRTTNGQWNFNHSSASLSYKHIYPKDGKDWTADIDFDQSRSNNNSTYNTQYYDQPMQAVGLLQQQQQYGTGFNRFLTAQTDYENPITEKMKVEAGARAAFRDYVSDNHVAVFNYDSAAFIEVPDLNNYEYNDAVLAAYATFSNQIEKFQYQAGLRVESSFYTGTLTDVNESFTNNYPLSFFPSAYLQYALNKTSNLQLNYSRKISRPNFFQLRPFTDYSDSLNLERGNPDLKPQFTNTVELSYEKNLSHNSNFIGSVYFKNSNNLITEYQILEYDSVLQEDAIINTYENANSSYLYGIELTSTNNIHKWITLTGDFNLYESYINGNNLEDALVNKQLSWFAKLDASFKLPANFTFQLNGDYTSRTSVPQSSGGHGPWGAPPATLQGYVSPIYSVDVALKKDFLKNKNLSVTLSVRDVFRSRVFESVDNTDYYNQTSSRFRDPQFIRLNVSWRFGKFDTSLFKRKNMSGGSDSMQDVPQQ